MAAAPTPPTPKRPGKPKPRRIRPTGDTPPPSPVRHYADFTAALLAWFQTGARDLPWRRTRDPYAIWVSEIMLQQTQVKTVIPYWERWMQHLPTPGALAAAAPETVHKLWEGLGYYSRGRRLQEGARVIQTEHGGVFPHDFAAILALPGVGRYTAGAIASIAFNQPRPILDGNVIRVLARHYGIAGNPRARAVNETLWSLAQDLVTTAATASSPPRAASAFNQALMELGALVCTPRQPQCPSCPVRAACVARRTNRVGELPATPPRPEATKRWFVAVIPEWAGRYLVRRRPEGGVNAGLWEFPNLEFTGGAATTTGADPVAAARAVLGPVPCAPTPLATVRHSITRYRITLTAHRAVVTDAVAAAALPGEWRTPAELAALSFPSAHRKLCDRLPHPARPTV